MTKPITIDMLSKGDNVYYVKQKRVVTVTETMLDILKTLNANITDNISRIPCTPDNTKVEDWVWCEKNERIEKWFAGHLRGDFIPLKKELAEHLAKQKQEIHSCWNCDSSDLTFDMKSVQVICRNCKTVYQFTSAFDLKTDWNNNVKYSSTKQKPLFANAAVGDLVRFSNGVVLDVISVGTLSFTVSDYVAEDGKVFNISDGKSYYNSTDIHATDLIKKGSAEWAKEMLLKGKTVIGLHYCYRIINGTLWDLNRNQKSDITDLNRLFEIAYLVPNWQIYEPKSTIRLDESENKNPRTKTMTKQQRTDLFNKGKEVGFKAGYEKGFAEGQATVKFCPMCSEKINTEQQPARGIT